MNSELNPTELPLMAGAVALGAVCAMVAVLLLFPVIDRFIRPRFNLERGGAMLVLLAAGLLVGLAGGIVGFFWLQERELQREEEVPAEQVFQSLKAEELPLATSVFLTPRLD